MFQDTQPAPLADGHGPAQWAEFRVDHPREVQALLRELRDGQALVHLSGPQAHLSTTLWALDANAGRLSFSADEGQPQLQALIDGDEAVAVAYLDSVKLQFELQGLVLVRGLNSCALQASWPPTLYRFQRRQSFRVRPGERGSPTVRFRHPALPDMVLDLRVLDVSMGGCALLLPADVPPLEPGTRIGAVRVDLDADTRFDVMFSLQHVTALNGPTGGLRLGCEWGALGGGADRALQRWIDHTQKRRRLLTAG